MKKLFKSQKTKVAIALGALATLLAGSFASFAVAATPVQLESDLTVANATAGDTSYKNSVNAKVDDVVKYSVYYHNTEPTNGGRYATNVNVKVNIPTTFAKTHTATSTVGGTNTNTITDMATVNTEINTTLNYIPGTAYRKYNKGTDTAPSWVTEKISDSVVTNGYVIPQLRGCCNFQETITVQARVKAPVFTVDKFVKVEGGKEWQRTITANPGDKLAYLIVVKNVSNVKLNNVIVQDIFPTRLQYVSGSAKLYNVNYPNGYQISDNLIKGGANLGNYGINSNAQVRFNAIIPKDLSEGCWKFDNKANVKADETGWVNNNAITTVCYKKSIPPKPPITPEKPVTPTIEKPGQLPVSGPQEAALAFGTFSMSGAVLSYLRSKKNLKNTLLNR